MQHQQRRNNKYFAFGLVILALTFAPFAYASTTSGSIDATYKYAWGSVGGWINLAPDQAGLTITDTAVTGHAWAQNTGWINFSPTQGGVTNDGSGNLGGFAWDESGGWVSFAGVTIDTSGNFHGHATGGTVQGGSYTINFDCDYCHVRTDWRPASARAAATAVTGNYGSNGSPLLLPPSNPPAPTTPAPAPLPEDHPAASPGATGHLTASATRPGTRGASGGVTSQVITAAAAQAIQQDNNTPSLATTTAQARPPKHVDPPRTTQTAPAPKTSLLHKVIAAPATFISWLLSFMHQIFHAI